MPISDPQITTYGWCPICRRRATYSFHHHWLTPYVRFLWSRIPLAELFKSRNEARKVRNDAD